MNNQPKIRFKGFYDAWEQRKLGELAERHDNLRVPVTATDRISGNTPYYGANGIQDYVRGFTHDGEFILVAEDGASDLKNYPVQYVNGKIWVNNHAHVLKADKRNSNSRFLMCSIISTNMERYLVGGSRAKLNSNIMMNIEFKIPSLSEQIKIGDFFKTLDDTIALHQRNIELLEQFKKVLLKQIFPCEDEKYPKIRFCDFKDYGAWERRKVGEIFKVTRGNVLASIKTVNKATHENPYPVYSSQTKNGGLMGYYSDYLFDTAITWTTDGANAGTVKYREGKFYSTNVNGVLLSENIRVCQAIAEALNNVAFRFVSKVGNPKLMNNIMSQIEINIPIQVPEQCKISDFFKTLDDTITLHRHTIDLQKQLKKSFLEIALINS